MPRPKNPVPTYRLHKQSGQAVVTVSLDGRRKDVLLGRHGTPESKQEYERVLAELRRPGGSAALARPGGHADLTVNELLVAFLRHVEGYYRRPDGTPTSEVYNFKLSLRPVRELYGHTPAAGFGPLALKAVRDWMVGRRWCRAQVNARVGRVKRYFRWAVSEELVPATTHQALAAVAGLQAGRSAAPDRDPVGPVAAEHVEAVLPHLNPVVAAMVRVQWLTGMRPGEVCTFRPADVDTSGPVWLYRPRQHKTGWRGKSRVVAVGPRAQDVLREFWPADPAACVFSPGRAAAWLHAARAAARKTPLYPSHARANASKRVAAPERAPAGRYTVTSYGRAVARGIDRTNRDRAEPPVPHWHPNQLRHAHATEVRKRFGLEAAQVALGHERCDVTQVYAEKNLDLAARVAAAVG